MTSVIIKVTLFRVCTLKANFKAQAKMEHVLNVWDIREPPVHASLLNGSQENKSIHMRYKVGNCLATVNRLSGSDSES